MAGVERPASGSWLGAGVPPEAIVVEVGVAVVVAQTQSESVRHWAFLH